MKLVEKTVHEMTESQFFAMFACVIISLVSLGYAAFTALQCIEGDITLDVMLIRSGIGLLSHLIFKGIAKIIGTKFEE